jgi:arginyl-tRNA synthetase
MYTIDDAIRTLRSDDRFHNCLRGPVNECEDVLVEHEAIDRCVVIEPRRDEDQRADLRLLFADRMWLRSPAGRALVAALHDHPLVSEATRHKAAVLLRFDDIALTALEHRLAAGELVGLNGSNIFDGRRFMVSFVGANTNKALHVGHLRNIVLGQALASALTAAGADVQRHSLVGDIGRRVCEAMVGYLAAHNGETPQTLGLPSDRFVELCSRDCPRETVQSVGGEDPNAEEIEAHGDCADAIMHAWLVGAPDERALWRRMRDWATDGHRRTLARLGVTIDRHDCESQAIDRALELIAKGLHAGLLERETSGSVIYRTGRSEYATMVLQREDGALTEYGRLLGLYDPILTDLNSQAQFVEVVGIEWQPAAKAIWEVLQALRKDRGDRLEFAYHGSVTVAGRKMGSSTGEVTWIEDLLDDLAASEGVSRLHELSAGEIARERLADMIVRGAFLSSPTAQPLAFSYDRLRAGGSGPGWTIAQAWCRAQQPCKLHSGSLVARTAIVQSQLYQRSLRRAVASRDTAGLASYVVGLCEACLASREPWPAAAPILRCVLKSLGFLVSGHGEHHYEHESQAQTPARPQPLHAGGP